ncbi:hypothetical protein CL614_07230 [archaeon]|nr:hypothetical protein [archaeon]|tara:strand:+ start:3071 stop:3820 length:750 start_codon:yes stop_codon:yes gene_type:complete
MVKKKAKKKVKKGKNVLEKIEDFGEELHESTEKEDKEMHVGKAQKNKENKQLIWFFVIVGIIFASFLGTYFYVQSLKTFGFAGAEWAKEDYSDELTLYHGRFPIVYKNEIIANYNLYLRNDPRENNVPGTISVGFYPNVVISNSPEAAKCRSAGRITGDLSMLISAFPWVTNVTGAVRDDDVADEFNLTQADCSLAKNKTVIIIQKSESPEITQDKFNENCYIIKTGECENVLAIERFMVEIIDQMQNK